MCVWTAINNLTRKKNEPENMGCSGIGVLHFMSQVGLIAFPVCKAMPPKLSTGYASRYSSRQPSILIVWSIDTHRPGSQHLPLSHLHPLSVSIAACLSTFSYMPLFFFFSYSSSSAQVSVSSTHQKKSRDNCQCCSCCRCE